MGAFPPCPALPWDLSQAFGEEGGEIFELNTTDAGRRVEGLEQRKTKSRVSAG